jgi:heavy metal efflux system protein
VLLFAWGILSFRNLPIEAYPDVANNYVQVITQWPGRAAEEVEQQVTIPIEIAMAGIPHMQHLRSVSLAGLSSVTMVFDDESTNDWNREHGWRGFRKSLCQPICNRRWAPIGVRSVRFTGTHWRAPIRRTT